MAEDETVGWHHRLNGHEFEQALGIVDGQGSLACFNLWRQKADSGSQCLEVGRKGQGLL